jgi:hypothetical protein
MVSFSPYSNVFNNQRFSNCRSTMNVGFVTTLVTLFLFFVETVLRRTLSSTVTFAAVLLWFTVTVLFNVGRSLPLSFCFQPLFLLADDVLPWFVYVVITLGTAALDTCKKVAVLITDAPAKHAPTICPLWKSEMSPILQYSHTNCYEIQSVMHWHWHYTAETNKRITKYKLMFLILRWLMSCIYGVHILDVSISHTTTQHSW